MKPIRLILLVSLLLGSPLILADTTIHATTDDGRAVLLSPDGSWKYTSDATATPTGKPVVTPAIKSAAPKDVIGGHLEGGNGSYAVRYDETTWHIIDNLNDSMEYALQHKSGNVIAMLIYENLSVPLDTLKKAVLKNATNAAPDLKLLNEKRITKNGKQIMVLKYRGSVSGKSFTYYGYYTSGDWGTLQFTVYSPTSVYNQHEGDMFALLDGLQLLK